jgi:hypothetical protein
MRYEVALELYCTFDLVYYWIDIAYLTSIIFQYTLKPKIKNKKQTY